MSYSSFTDTTSSKSINGIGVSSVCDFAKNASLLLTLALYRPWINYHCDINYDPFLYLEENDKLYGTCPML